MAIWTQAERPMLLSGVVKAEKHSDLREDGDLWVGQQQKV